MDDLANVTPENYLQVITALVARLKRVEQHLNLLEPEPEPDVVPSPLEPMLEEEDEAKAPVEDADRRFMQLKTHLLPFIDKHLKEERGLFMDGASARDVLHNLFQAHSPGGIMIPTPEKRRLSKWVTSSLKAWRRKDFLRLTKSAFNTHLVQAYGPDSKVWEPESVVNEALHWVESEVVLKYELGPLPADGLSILKSDMVQSSFRRFIITIVHNLVSRDSNDFLPLYLQWKPNDAADSLESALPDASEEPLEPEDLVLPDQTSMDMEEEEEALDDEEPRKRNAKRKSREEESDAEESDSKRSRPASAKRS